MTFSAVGDPSPFSVDSNGDIRVADSSQLDFDVPPASFTLTVEVSDGVLTDTAEITIDLTGVNEAPVVESQTFTIPENTANNTVVDRVVASDPDANTVLTFSAVGDPSPFSVDANGDIRVADSSQLDFDVPPASFTLTVEVSDGVLTDTAEITIDLTGVNEAPVVENQTFDVDEGNANGTLVGTVLASDPDANEALGFSIINGTDAFNIDADGNIRVLDSNQLDFDTSPQFILTVEVTDVDGLSDTATITIDLNEVAGQDPQLIPLDDQAEIDFSAILHNRRSRISQVNGWVINTTNEPLTGPVYLVIEQISHASVTPTNATGTIGPDGQIYYDFTALLPTGGLLPGQATEALTFSFDNPDLERFTIQVRLYTLGS